MEKERMTMATNGETTRLLPDNFRARQMAGNDVEDQMGRDGEFGPDGYHQSSMPNPSVPSCCGDCIKSLIFGGFDGLLSSIIIISGTAGADLSWRVVIVLGIASALANSFSTGVSEYLSSKAHREFIQAEKRRELWEFKHYKDSEMHEMANRFEARGMGRRDAEAVVSKMAQYENFFVGLMVAEDLGLQLPEDDDAVLLTDAFIMFISYALFGAIPILTYCIGPWIVFSSATTTLYLFALIISLIVLSILGVVKSSFSASNWMVSGLEALLLGCACAGLSYVVGSQLNHLIVG